MTDPTRDTLTEAINSFPYKLCTATGGAIATGELVDHILMAGGFSRSTATDTGAQTPPPAALASPADPPRDTGGELDAAARFIRTDVARGIVAISLFRAGIHGSGKDGLPWIVAEGVQAAITSSLEIAIKVHAARLGGSDV